jgi:hypothetical protein
MEAETNAETLLFLPTTWRCKVHNVSVMQISMLLQATDSMSILWYWEEEPSKCGRQKEWEQKRKWLEQVMAYHIRELIL